jgi:hypothetical protein
MNNKPEITEPKSDGIVLNACLDLPDGLRHRHAQSVLEKYSDPDELAFEIIRETRGKTPDPVRLSKIQQILTRDVNQHGSDEEKLSLFI